MPRQPRLDIPDVLHHVIVRGIEQRDIFADDADKEHFLARLSSLLTKGATKCFAWALMSNHFHLLLMPTTVTLAETMRRLLTSYAVYFNRKYHRSGHLFQNRYKSSVCEEEPYFIELIRYIHLNPLRAGMVGDLEALERYRWSGHAVLLGWATMEGQETNAVLSRFGKSRVRAQRGYRQFVADGVATGRRDDLIGGGLKRSLLGCGTNRDSIAYDERVLGSGDFVEMVSPGNDRIERGNRSPSLTELCQKVCSATGVTPEQLRSPGKERTVARARAIFCCLAYKKYGYTGKAAGQEVGLSPVGASLAVRRGWEILQREPEIEGSIEN